MRNFVLVASIFNMALLVLLVAKPLRADLIINGGFEDPVSVFGTVYSPGSTIGSAGWTTIGDVGTNVYVVNTTGQEIVNGVNAFNSHSGSNSLDPTGPYNQGPNSGVQQIVSTSIGVNYTLRFWVGTLTPSFGAGVASFYHDPGTIDLSIDGGARISFTNANRTNGVVDWQQFSHSFNAIDSLTTIRFFNGTLPVNGIANFQGTGLSGSNYVALDDVSFNVTSVPETSSITFCLGVAAIGLLSRARLRRQECRESNKGSVLFE